MSVGVFALERSADSHDTQLSTYKNVDRAHYPCHSEIDPPFPKSKLFKNLVAQFIGLHLSLRATVPFLSLREAKRRSNLGGEATRLPRPDLAGLAITKAEIPDESGDYKNLEMKCEDNTWFVSQQIGIEMRRI